MSLNHFIASSLSRAVGLPTDEPQQISGEEGSVRSATGAETDRPGRSDARLVRLAIVTSLIVGIVAGVAAVILLIVASQQA